VFERFTDAARRVLVLAQEEATRLNHSFVGTEHILLGLIQEGEGLAAQALRSQQISFGDALEQVMQMIGKGPNPPGSQFFTPRAKSVLKRSVKEAHQVDDHPVGTEHLLLALLREGEGVAITILGTLGADLVRLRQETIRHIGGTEWDVTRRDET
jgi:ATP-dependent Clp protease ATP-binding subunit ClpC